MPAKEPTVERKYREQAIALLYDQPVSSEVRWVETGEKPADGVHIGIRRLERVAQALANAEAAAAAKAAEPFRLLMAHYEQGERVELYVGEGGSVYAESPSCYGYGDDVARAVESLCRALGLLPSEPAKGDGNGG